MTGAELKKIIQQGETSKVQFKELLDNQNSIAAEMIAFANTKGGLLLFGVKDKTGEITGLDYVQLQSTGNRLATIASDFVFPEVYITTETVEVDGRNVLCVEVQEGANKPYKDKNGTIWTKQGGDKRRVLDNHEQLRLFQQSKVIFVDEMTVPETSIEDINEDKISDYLRRINAKNLDLPKDILLKNMNVLKDGKLTIGGLLFFAKNPQQFRPTFSIKAVAFYGNDIAGKEYRDSRDINGTIPEMFYEAIGFFKTNLRHTQQGQSFNSLGILEISIDALEEVVQNALIHRDLTRNAPVRLMIFDNRVEIISPGALPNSLTVDNIKIGTAVQRNPMLSTFGSRLTTYRGLGTGIRRVLADHPDTQLINDTDCQEFKVIIPRQAM